MLSLMQAWAQPQEGRRHVVEHRDGNGAVLHTGYGYPDRDLNVKGANFTAKRNTAVRNISLVQDNPSQRIVILTQFVEDGMRRSRSSAGFAPVSSLAERLVTEQADPVCVATATAGDGEMSDRIRRHQLRRPPQWGLVEGRAGALLNRRATLHPPVCAD